jgi:ubiquinone/menaquinone biosynthesis C-methylase UbiE
LFYVKKIFSYIFDFPIEKRQSRFSGEVIVSFHKGQYKLSTANAIYSFGKNYTSFDIAFKTLDIQNINIENVLVLGFGLGSVVDLLEHHPTIKNFTAIDADEVIIQLAEKYLQTGLKNKVTYICEDAEKYITESSQKFELVLVDIYIDDATPLQFMQPAFLKELKKTIDSNGILLFSKIDDSHKSKIENSLFEKSFTAVFPEAFSIDANGNKIFTWINR